LTTFLFLLTTFLFLLTTFLFLLTTFLFAFNDQVYSFGFQQLSKKKINNLGRVVLKFLASFNKVRKRVSIWVIMDTISIIDRMFLWTDWNP
jgi:hypothetical protein